MFARFFAGWFEYVCDEAAAQAAACRSRACARTVSSFDRVIVLVDGRIVEDGPPDALREGGGLFAEMWQLQAEGFETA